MQELLEPVPGELRAGSDPRANLALDSRYLAIKDARNAARRKERASDIDPDSPQPWSEWSEVARLACELLGEEAKDLEVATWLIEALTRLDGFSGLRDGFDLAAGLVENYWDDAFPLIEDGDLEGRLLPYILLNGSNSEGLLVQPIRKIPLTMGAEPYAYWQYLIAQERSEGDGTDHGVPSRDTFDMLVRQTDNAFLAALVSDIEGALVAVNRLSDAFAVHVGADAPPTDAIRSLLQQILEAINYFARDKLARHGADAALEASNTETQTSRAGDADERESRSDSVEGNPRGPVRDREQALQQILEIAAYFRRAEPHSPVSYTLEETVRRARMPFGELLKELIDDESARRQFYVYAGIKPPLDNESDAGA